MTSAILVVALLVWAFGWGYCCRNAEAWEIATSVLWPVLLPAASAYHFYRWGPKSHRRYLYSDLRWWQRGEKERRPVRTPITPTQSSED